MSIVTRTGKGSKLTIAEMDANLTTLQSSSFQNGVYSQTVEGTGEIIGTFSDTIQFSNPIDSGTVGTYAVSPTTDGLGTGAEFELVVDESRGSFIINVDASSVLNKGLGYAVGDTLTVDLIDLGGNMGETLVFTLLAGGVDSAKTSIITVTEENIALFATNINITGSLESNGSIVTAGNIQGNTVIGINGLQGDSLTVVNLLGNTNIKFNNLPTSDPVDTGRLWNDSGSLKISAGV
jgi:hypothetical protein